MLTRFSAISGSIATVAVDVWIRPWDSVTGKVNDRLFDDNTKAWSGDHCIDPPLVPGVFFCSQNVESRTPAIIDIAPTALELFNVPIPAHMDGQSLIDPKNLSIDKKGKKNEPIK